MSNRAQSPTKPEPQKIFARRLADYPSLPMVFLKFGKPSGLEPGRAAQTDWGWEMGWSTIDNQELAPRFAGANDLAALANWILRDYALSPSGIHGLRHWGRVLETGLRLAADTGADPEDVVLFALFHDACRMNDGSDPGHGPRGADLAKSWLGHRLHLDQNRFDLLYAACRDHTGSHADPRLDVTIRTCWDADRLDLLRVGNHPRPDWLGTAAARALVPWANARAAEDFEPDCARGWALGYASSCADRTLADAAKNDPIP